ncbi:MAG: AraC family transcriptional regulator [Parabacteroides sp.]|nr:AraC family transcriptional regulator [Parabacteroides sp.]
MAITIPQISIDEVYISVLKAKLVKNEEGWSKMMPIDHAVRPSGSIIMDAFVRLLNEKRYYFPAEVAEYFQKKVRDLDGAIRVLTGMSLSRFMLLYRLKQVQEYLCCTSLTAIEIAIRCGYPNSSTMGYLFRKEFGMTPGMYRQAHRPRNYNELYAW